MWGSLSLERVGSKPPDRGAGAGAAESSHGLFANVKKRC
jgi:hypothetical protein